MKNMSFSASFYFILICAITISCHLPFTCRGNNETDRMALLEIKARMTHDPLGVMRSWNDTVHVCAWHGVTCGRRHPRVTALDLSSSKLTGTLSPFVGNLSFLRVLYLYSNRIGGRIPPQIGNLHRLRYLELHNNSLVGEIPPNISACSNLIDLEIDRNKLVGEIPVGIGSLSNLNFLSLNDNKLGGIIPSSLGNLTSLSELFLHVNSLVGNIPDSLGMLGNLTVLSIHNNTLSGTVPISIFNLSSLMGLDLGYNHLEGSIPLEFGTMLPNLQFLGIGNNEFTGSVPASITNSSNLATLSFTSNYLIGQVPPMNKLRLQKFSISDNYLGTGHASDLNFVSSLANATSLTVVDISFNRFGGTFHSTICNFSMLSVLALQVNHINGQIPTCIENLASLQVLDVWRNRLSGVIPLGIGKLKRLNYLGLSENHLSGSIPSTIGNLTQLTELFLGANNLEGHIPFTLGNCINLLAMNLSDNNLSGGIPPQLLSLPSFSMGLILSHNSLTGSLPREIGELKMMDLLFVSNTMLSGEIPSTLGSCTSLEYLILSGNFFQGTIPSTFIALRGLYELNLSLNNLSGKIPKFLETFSLERLDLSFNNFEGEVPTGGVFSNITRFSISGNDKLCGGIPELNLPPCIVDKARKRRLGGHKRRLIISLLSGTVGVILLAAFVSLYAFFCHKKRRKEPLHESDNGLPNLSYQSLVRATNGFSSENLIGSGTFGVVYKGTLDQHQITAAIKVFNLEHKASAKSFMAECQVLRNVRHRNLVKVITACSSVDHQRKDFKALVYEYMTNGSLEEWLHKRPTNDTDGSSDATRNINLLVRLEVAVDVAFALEYLHHYTGASIIHCDLKPSNILFDDEMVAHVGDFGLAKFLSNSIHSTQANQSSSVGVRGTIGYAPPEYGMGNEPSTYGDVYSFGILLLEMLTGKRPTDSMFKEGLNLHNFVKANIPDHVIEILDKALIKDIAGEETNIRADEVLLNKRDYSMVILEALTSALEIAISCSAQLPQERLDMSDVAPKLCSIRNKLLRTHLQRQQRRNLRGTYA